jgi:hypothetical protein
MKKLNAFPLLVALALLSGCKSEVDKCVDSEMKAWDSQQQKIRKDWEDWKVRSKQQEKNSNGGRDLTLELGLVVKPDERSRLEVEADERKSCMYIASGK